MTPETRAAIEASHLDSLSDTVLAGVLADSHRLRVPTGETVRREGERAVHVHLVVEGLLRVFVTAPDGRTMTIRYCRRGSLLGAASLFHTAFSLPASLQAVTDVDLLVLEPAVVQASVARHPAVARALLEELSERAMAFAAEVPGGAFASVRQRVARHLLDLATGSQHGPELVAHVGQQALADAVGTVREVVVRALGELRREGWIHTERGRVTIVHPERLAEEAQPAAGPSLREWNPGH